MSSALIYKDNSGTTQSWRYRVRAANGEIVDSSEGYASKANAKRALLNRWPQVERIQEQAGETP